MGPRAGRLTGRRPSLALGLALVALALSAIAGFLAHRATDQHDLEVERTRNASQMARIEEAMTAAVAVTREVAVEAAHGDFVTAATKRTRSPNPLAFVLTRGADIERVVTEGGEAAAVRAVAEHPVALAAREAAVADADIHVVAPVDLDGEPAVVFVAPGYPSGTPGDVVTRRAANPAVVLGIIAFSSLRDPEGLPSLWPGADVRVETAQGSIGPEVDDPVLASDVRAGDAAWRIAVGRSDAGSPIAGFAILLVGLALAVAVYVLVRRYETERRRVEAEVDVRSRQLQLIASTGASLQQSLDLAELLPAFAISVTDEFRLSSLTISLSDDAGELVAVFRHGRALPPEACDTFDLRRGWRTVGQLAVHPEHPFDDVSRQSLQAVADLLAIAVTNSQLYEREQQAVNRLSELDALKNAFLSTVSHELRTATTAVQGFADLLSEHWDTTPDERRHEMAKRIRRQSGSLRHLVDDLLDYARLDAERLRVSPRRINLSEIVEHVTESFSPLVSSHRLVVHAEPDLHAWADPIAVERILANLLSNAGKYAPPGTTVTVTVREHGGCARLSVGDEGPGIPEAERRRVFVRFYRLDNPQTIRTHGAGIGLAILHDFADRSGAAVVIEDAPGGGALVHVDFPTAPIPAMSGRPS
jgi:signal transduction histidine kinase